MDDTQNLSEEDLKGMLVSAAWQRVREEWKEQMDVKPKLLKLRGGIAAFEIETGRWHEVSREDRVCKECGSGEVENVSHWLLRCAAWEEL